MREKREKERARDSKVDTEGKRKQGEGRKQRKMIKAGKR